MIFLAKNPEKVVQIRDPANTDIAPESSKREGYFSGRPKIKFQNTGRQNVVCHMLLSTDKNLQKSGRTDGTDGRNGQAGFAHSNVKGASAKISGKNIKWPLKL